MNYSEYNEYYRGEYLYYNVVVLICWGIAAVFCFLNLPSYIFILSIGAVVFMANESKNLWYLEKATEEYCLERGIEVW